MLNENTLSICRLNLINSTSLSRKKTPEKCTFYGWCFKNKRIKYLNTETWLLFAPPPTKISGYAPGRSPQAKTAGFSLGFVGSD